MPDLKSRIAPMEPWIGRDVPSRRVLILGESWYGKTSDNLFDFLSRWCRRDVRDFFFSRVFNAASDFHTRTATDLQRAAFWNSVLFDNFINQSVGQTRDCRPDESHFKAAARSFPDRLKKLHPHAVWVLGKEQAYYSVPILKEANCRHIVSPHPCSYGVTTGCLKNDWAKL